MYVLCEYFSHIEGSGIVHLLKRSRVQFKIKLKFGIAVVGRVCSEQVNSLTAPAVRFFWSSCGKLNILSFVYYLPPGMLGYEMGRLAIVEGSAVGSGGRLGPCELAPTFTSAMIHLQSPQPCLNN